MNAPLDHMVMERTGIPRRDLSGMPEAFRRVFGPSEPFQTDLGDHERDDLCPIPYQGQRPINPRSRGACRIFAVFPDLPTHTPRVYGLDSQIEYNNLVLTLVDPSVAQVHEQVGPIPFFDDAGDLANHYIDLLVIKTDGRKVAVAVKPTSRLESGRFMRELQQLKRTMPAGIADELRLVTEQNISRSDAFNAAMYLRFSLTPDAEVDELLRRHLLSMSGAMTVGDICRSCCAGGRAFRCVVRAIYEGGLHKLSQGRINLFTLVETP